MNNALSTGSTAAHRRCSSHGDRRSWVFAVGVEIDANRYFQIDNLPQWIQGSQVERHSRCGGEADRLVMSGSGRVAKGFEEGLTRGR
jgi:hypothetical protein